MLTASRLVQLLVLTGSFRDSALILPVTGDNFEAEENFWLEGLQSDEFTNWHRSIDVGGPFNRILRPMNDIIRPNEFALQSVEFMSGLQNLQNQVAIAKAFGSRIRAYGSRWSMSNVAYDDGFLIETWGLTYCKLGMDMAYLTPTFQPKKDRLVFSQTGVMIKYLNEFLATAGYSLSVCGGTDGQRLAGAIATGTHASFPFAGSMQEMVRGMHIVLNNETVYLQKASDPVVTTDFLTSIGNPRLIEDDDIFGAALVNLGSMGIIHAMLIEVEPLFPIRVGWESHKYEDKKNVISSRDMKELSINGIKELPFSFQVGVNPYNKKLFFGAYEKLISNEGAVEAPSRESDVQLADPIEILLDMIVNSSALRFADRTFGSLFGVGAFFKRLIYGQIIGIGYTIYYNTALKQSGKFLKDIWTGGNTDTEELDIPLPSTEMEMAVPVDRALEAVELISGIIRRRPLLHPLSVRYTKKSDATLEFTRYDETATISLFGPWGKFVFPETEDVFEEIFAAMAQTDIDHCYHWGKKQPKDPSWVDRCLGSAKDEWITQRARFLDDEGQRMFANEFLENVGLYVPP